MISELVEERRYPVFLSCSSFVLKVCTVIQAIGLIAFQVHMIRTLFGF